jgi:uncharacterized membrane protein YfcA
MLCKFERNAGRKQVVCLCSGEWFTLEVRAAFKLRCPREALVNWMMLLVGLLVGVFSGVVGIGGGILFIPALVWLAGMSQHKAQGTSLGALLLPVGIFAFLEYYRKGNADIRVALLLAVGFLIGGYFGAVGAQHIPDLWLRRIFAVTMIAVGGKLLFSR